MYAESQLWIMDELMVELPDLYLSTITHFPFYDYEGTTDMELWDNPKEIINQTKRWRQGRDGLKPWPHKWIQIGHHSDGPYALNCKNGKIRMAIGGDIKKPGLRFADMEELIDYILDGYRGKLPEGWKRKDSTFRTFDFRNEVNWEPPYQNIQGHHLYGNQVLKRIDQSSVTNLVKQLKAGGVHVIRIHRKEIPQDNDFYDEFWEAIWHDNRDFEEAGSRLEARLASIANNGLLHVAIIWEHMDECLAEDPYHMMDAASYLQDLFHWQHDGYYIDVFYLGSPENGFTLKVRQNVWPWKR
ncbi:MAG: hypothetical protein AAF391_10955, partial [Bacteroidota bacterium]